MKVSAFFTIGKRDFFKGFIVSIGTAAMTGCMQSLNSGSLPNHSDLKVIGIASLAAGGSYVLKNLLTNSEDKFMKKEPKQEATTYTQD